MRRKPAYRYYCDYCKKSSGSGSAMAIHEKHCTMNPNRECRFCVAGVDDCDMKQQPIGDLIAALGCGDEAGMKALRELAAGCPACMLAAIRQSGLRERDEENWSNDLGTYYPQPDPKGYWTFDFNKKAAEFWADVDSNRREEDGASYQGCW